jgi:soluble lytic murein transglycosylase
MTRMRRGLLAAAVVVAVGGTSLWWAREPLLRAGGRLLYPFPFRDAVVQAADKAGVDPLLVIAVMREESGFSPHARSRAGATGLMQLMPGTAKWIARRAKLDVADLNDPEQNIRLGAAYLGYLKGRYGDDVPRILAAYNGGQGNVERWGDLSQAFPETQRYVRRGIQTYARYRWIYAVERARAARARQNDEVGEPQ